MNREKAFAVLLGSVAARVEHHPSKQIILELAHLAPRARVRPLLEDAPNAVAHQVLNIRAQVEIVGEGRNKVAEVCLRAPTPDSVQCRLRFESTRKRGRKEERERGERAAARFSSVRLQNWIDKQERKRGAEGSRRHRTI